jgi:argininosuccinate synthase
MASGELTRSKIACGMKTRGAYETPAVLLVAHQELERLTIDRDRDFQRPFAALRRTVYYGLWFARCARRRIFQRRATASPALSA